MYRVTRKLAPFLYVLTLPNMNRFEKLFHYQNQKRICITKDHTTPQVCRFTTLWNVKCLKSNNWKQDDFYNNTARILQFLPNFYIFVALVTMLKYGTKQYTHGLRWHAKFHLNVFIVSVSGGQKPQFLGKFWHLVTPLPTPFTDEGQIWYARVDPCTVTVYAHMPNSVSTGIFFAL